MAAFDSTVALMIYAWLVASLSEPVTGNAVAVDVLATMPAVCGVPTALTPPTGEPTYCAATFTGACEKVRVNVTVPAVLLRKYKCHSNSYADAASIVTMPLAK